MGMWFSTRDLGEGFSNLICIITESSFRKASLKFTSSFVWAMKSSRSRPGSV